MKKIVLLKLKISMTIWSLIIATSLSSGQCPTPPSVWDISNGSPVIATCGVTDNISFIVRVVEDQNPENVYSPGPKDASCFILPTGWSFVSASRGGTETDLNVEVRKWTVTLKPGAY